MNLLKAYTLVIITIIIGVAYAFVTQFLFDIIVFFPLIAACSVYYFFAKLIKERNFAVVFFSLILGFILYASYITGAYQFFKFEIKNEISAIQNNSQLSSIDLNKLSEDYESLYLKMNTGYDGIMGYMINKTHKVRLAESIANSLNVSSHKTYGPTFMGVLGEGTCFFILIFALFSLVKSDQKKYNTLKALAELNTRKNETT